MKRPTYRRLAHAAEAVAIAIPWNRLQPEVLEWAECHARSRSPWCVALSGGADSVALLLLLWTHWPERRGRLQALHFDHRLRGAASRADAAYCRRLCSALDVPLVNGVWKRPKEAAAPSEADAREARLAFFSEHARVLWLGHHQDDVAETMLMRLARGSGAGGLSAPRPVQPMPAGRVHLRPLLGVRKEELVVALRNAGVDWREDASNARGDYFRNRIRRDVVPAWAAAAQRDVTAGAARSRSLLAEDDAALEAWTDRVAQFTKAGDLSIRRLTEAPRAIRRRALHRWLLQCGAKIDISRQAFDALLSATERGKPTRHSLGRELFAVVSRNRVQLVHGKPRSKFQRGVN
jgi:tRNA(Ile)-lysidine synthase